MIQPSRRQFLSLSISALSMTLAGCAQLNSEDGVETETHSPEDAEPGCWPSMCAGTQILEVDVHSGFSGTVVLKASCRDETISLQSGESVQIVREKDAETCGVALFIDNEQVYSKRIDGHTSTTVSVKSNGEINEEGVMQ